MNNPDQHNSHQGQTSESENQSQRMQEPIDAPSNNNYQQQPHDNGMYQKKHNNPEHRRPVGKPNQETVRKAKEFVIFMYMAIAALLGFRFVLSLLGANAKSPFVSFVYDVTYPALLPFDGMFGRDLYRPSGYTLEFEVLVALLVYAVVFYGFNRLIDILFD